MVAGSHLAVVHEVFRDAIDDVAVLGVDADGRAVASCALQHLEELAVVQHHRPLVRHEDLEARDALADETAHIGDGVGIEPGEDHVERVIDRRLMLGLRRPLLEGVPERAARGLGRVVDDGGRASDRRGDRARGEGVGGLRAADRSVEVRVHVDASRKQVFSCDVDAILAGDRAGRGDLDDPAVFDHEVRGECALGGDDGTAGEQAAILVLFNSVSA